MVSQGRFELPTFPLGGGCSIQLSYWDTVCQHQNGRQRDGVHVNGTGRFCHVVFGLQGCGPFPFKQGVLRVIMHFALPQKAIIAKRMQCPANRPINSLIYMDIYPY